MSRLFLIVITAGLLVGRAECQELPEVKSELHKEALKNSPDLRVAEAELRLAEARFERARAKLLSDVTASLLGVEAARFIEKKALERENKMASFLKRKVIGQEEYGTVRLLLIKAKNERISAEAGLTILLGGAPEADLSKELDAAKLHAQALKSNPIHRAAEAKLNLARTDFTAERLTLLAKVSAAEAEVHATLAAEREGESRFKRAKILFDKKNLSHEELAQAETTYLTLVHEREMKEISLYAMVGRSTLRKAGTK